MGDPYGRYPPPGYGPPHRQDHTFRNIVLVIVLIVIVVIAFILVKKYGNPLTKSPPQSPSAPAPTVTVTNPAAPPASPPPAPATSAPAAPTKSP